ncbi:MAG: hypothetical protein FH753_00075 [Firmicutes bacterium]|nr:hypothetical protein [Bacillota bacterium]
MNKKLILILFITMLTSLIIGSFSVAQGYNETIKAYFECIDFTINDKNIKLDTIKYKNTTYIPIITVTKILNENVNYDSETKVLSTKNTWIPPVDETQILGKWKSIDYVDKIQTYNPSKKYFNRELFLEKMNFEKTKVNIKYINSNKICTSKWLDQTVIHKGNKTASRFYIKNINDEKYMFYEWKSGDYINDKRKPKYYVLRKIKPFTSVKGYFRYEKYDDNLVKIIGISNKIKEVRYCYTKDRNDKDISDFYVRFNKIEDSITCGICKDMSFIFLDKKGNEVDRLFIDFKDFEKQ